MEFDHSNLANPWTRVLVSFIDGTFVFLAIVVGVFTLFIPLLVLVGISIYLYFWRGQTPAMYLFKMRVISVHTGEQAAPLTMLLRMLVTNGIGWLIGFFTAGVGLLLWIACMAPMFFNEKRQEVWDLMVSTTVVNDPSGSYLRSQASREKSATQSLSDDLDLEL